MIYKLNMFLREWEGYDKFYSFLKDNILLFLIIKALLYFLALIFCFLKLELLMLILRAAIYFVLFFAEYFIGCIQRENDEKFLSLCSYFLMLMSLLLSIFCIINIFV